MPFILMLPFLIGADSSSQELDEALRKQRVVASVEIQAATTQATKRIIHILDWHYVDEKRFIADIKDVADEELSEDEIEEAVEQHRKTVRKVQEQEKRLILLWSRSKV